MGPTGTEIKISARLLRDFFAGKIDEKQFRRRSGLGDDAPRGFFENKTIMDSRVEHDPGSRDDDHVVFHLGRDPSSADFS
jgi:hypothetical protein